MICGTAHGGPSGSAQRQTERHVRAMSDATIHINLAGLPARIRRSLQSATNLVAIGLNASGEIPQRNIPAGGIEFRYGTNEPWPPERSQQEWVQWVLLNGFRDAAESVNAILEEARTVLAIWRLKTATPPDAGVTVLDWQATIVAAGRPFHRLGLPDKLDRLSTEYGVTLEPSLLEQLLSINTARNCLVHRAGVISEREKNSGNGFELSWRALVALAQGPDGDREVVPPVELRAGEGLGIGTRSRRKQFAIGDRFTVSAEEFAQICWTLFVFVQSLAENLEQLGRAQGLVFNESPRA
jgi:hypothetical protein